VQPAVAQTTALARPIFVGKPGTARVSDSAYRLRWNELRIFEYAESILLGAADDHERDHSHECLSAVGEANPSIGCPYQAGKSPDTVQVCHIKLTERAWDGSISRHYIVAINLQY
jgi:hypothetical protein